MIPTSTNVVVEVRSSLPTQAQAVVVFVAEGGQICGDAPRLLDDAALNAVQRMINAGLVRGKAKEVAVDLLDQPRGKALRVYAAGVGKAEKLSPESVRKAAGAIARGARKHRINNIAVVPPVITTPGQSATEAVVTGFLLASFDYSEYHGAASKKKEAEDPAPKKTTLTILSTEASMKQIKPLVERGRAIGDAQNFCRTIAHRPGNDINPPALARVAGEAAKEFGLGFRVLDEKQMQKLGMGGILAVGAGSVGAPPRMIIMEHKPKGKAPSGKGKSAGPILLVGKGITFDTGGISIKPAEKMGKMVFDKCGAMAVLGAMCAIAKLKLPVHVIGILASAENHISHSAYRPGDLLRMYNGVTVEVTNTDAEGRLVLADALAWGIETYKPSAVVDLATLTGGVVVALGKTMAGVMSNSDELVRELCDTSEVTGEKLWRLPLGTEQKDQIRSDDADIVNSAGREAHPLQGGAFLSYFVPDDDSIPWAHLDIAGVADTEKELPYYGKGATGWGVRTLVEWIARKAK